MSLRQGYGGKIPIVPNREAIKEKSSQGAKRALMVGFHMVWLSCRAKSSHIKQPALPKNREGRFSS